MVLSLEASNSQNYRERIFTKGRNGQILGEHFILLLVYDKIRFYVFLYLYK